MVMQLSEEGYNVIVVPYPSQADALQSSFSGARTRLASDTEWALVTYGLESADLTFAGELLSAGHLKACAHFCPQIEDGKGLIHELGDGTTLP